MTDHRHHQSRMATLEAELHRSQAGQSRHCCVHCAYSLGREAAIAAMDRDGRVSAWTEAKVERCTHGSAAPVADVASLPPNQGDGRHLCALCAWVKGWQEAMEENHAMNKAG